VNEQQQQQQQQQQEQQQQQMQQQNQGDGNGPALVPQQQPVPMGYVPHGGPAGYYQPMPGRGGPMQHQYPPQNFGPRQFPHPGQPQPYYQGVPMHQQNMGQYPIRGGGFPQAPYMQQVYAGGPRQGGIDEDMGGYRGNGGRGGRGGRGGGRRSGRRGGGRGNSGRGGYNNNYSNNNMNNSIHQQGTQSNDAGSGTEQPPATE